MKHNTLSILLVPAVGLILSQFGAAVALSEGFGRIVCRVTEKNTGKPLYMATLILDGRAAGPPTDADGISAFERVAAGNHRVLASYIGYRTDEKDLTVKTDQTVVVDFALEEQMIYGDEIVVTATRIPTYIKDVPVRTEVITRKELKDKGAVNLFDALEGLPGIRVESRCAFCNFSTVRLQGLGPDHAQVLIDGQPVYSGLASVYGLQQMPMENIEQIEVVKGAGSALYGAKAIAGVINIITRKPGNKPLLKLSSSVGSYGTDTYALTATAKTENADATLTTQKTTGREIDENGNGFADRVRTDAVALGAKINRYRLLGQDRLTITARSINEDRLGGNISFFENPFSESTERIETNRYEAGLSYRRTLAADDELVAGFSYVTHNRNATNDAFLTDYIDTHSGEVPPVDELSPFVADERLFAADLGYSHALRREQRFLVGFQYSHNNLDEEGRYIMVDEEEAGYGTPYTSRSQKHADDYGLYIQDEIDVREGLDVVAGGRYDIHRSEDDFGGSGDIAPRERIAVEYKEESFNPRAAVCYRRGDVSLRASVGTGFRVPYGFSEDLHLCSGSPRVNKPANLEPEKSVSYNLGVDCSKPALNLSINLFRTDLKGRLDFTDAGEESKRLGYSYEWANIGNAFTQGIEIGMRMLVLKNLTASADFAYTDAQYENERTDWATAHPEFTEESKFIPRVPKCSGGLKLDYTPERTSLVLDLEYTGSMYVDYCQEENIDMPGSKIRHTEPFVIANVRASFEIDKWGLAPFVGAKNIFDYVQDEKRLDDAAYVWAPWVGRIVYAGLEAEF